MRRIQLSAIAMAFLSMAGCASKATTPLPTDEFTAVGRYSNSIGSIELAQEQAEGFCGHWGAKPGILASKTIDLREVETVADAAKSVAKNAVTGTLFERQFSYETTLKYKCY